MAPSETTSPLVVARFRPVRLRLGLLALLLPLLGIAALWICHEPALNGLGRFLVEETPLSQADLVVVFGNNEVSAAAEAADIVGKGYAPRILLFKASPAPDETLLDRLRIPVPTRHELAIIVMRRMGIAAGDILVEPITEAGTNAEVRSTARYAQSHGASRIIVLTYRSHTRRTAVLLRGALDRSSVIIVRAAPDDPFKPEGWWRDRGNSREFLIESMRWANSIWFGDFWRRRA
jgi:uncharacterized SAM-binding protein YcdF (DUF218 family)